MATPKRRPATREDHDDFCTIEGWLLVRGAAGKPVRHHRTYELSLWDGRVLRTRISRPVDRTEYAPSMWAHILREHLEVAADVFWACVTDRLLPERGAPATVVPRAAVPLYLVRALSQLGVADDEIFALDAAQAAHLHARLLTERQG